MTEDEDRVMALWMAFSQTSVDPKPVSYDMVKTAVDLLRQRADFLNWEAELDG